MLLSHAAFCPLEGKDEFGEEHSFEVLRDDESFSSVLATIPDGDCEVPLSLGGEVWHPAVDFSQFVVGWIYLGAYGSCRSGVTAVTARQESDRVEVELTLAAPGNLSLGTMCYPYAFVQLPRVDVPYVFQEIEGAPDEGTE